MDTVSEHGPLRCVIVAATLVMVSNYLLDLDLSRSARSRRAISLLKLRVATINGLG